MIPLSKPFIGDEEKKAVMRVLDSGQLAQGPVVAAFEKEFGTLCDVPHAVAVNSGTAALHAALYAIGVTAGNEVITIPFTFVATANSIIMQGATPVFVDIDPVSYNIDPRKIEEKITPKTKAILAVDLYGQPAAYGELKKIAEKHHLLIVEDAAQSVLATFNGIPTGGLADIATFSFYATKNMMTGEGGMVTTNNAEYAERCRRFRHHGQSEQTRYQYYDLGYNYRMMDLQAAIGIEQLKRIRVWTQQRQAHAAILSAGLRGIKGMVLPMLQLHATHAYHQYTIRITSEAKLNRDQLAAALKEKGIGCGIYYPKPLHLHPAFLKMGYKEGDFPVSEQASKEVLSIPVHAALSHEDVQTIIRIIKELLV